MGLRLRSGRRKVVRSTTWSAPSQISSDSTASHVQGRIEFRAEGEEALLVGV